MRRKKKNTSDFYQNSFFMCVCVRGHSNTHILISFINRSFLPGWENTRKNIPKAIYFVVVAFASFSSFWTHSNWKTHFCSVVQREMFLVRPWWFSFSSATMASGRGANKTNEKQLHHTPKQDEKLYFSGDFFCSLERGKKCHTLGIRGEASFKSLSLERNKANFLMLKKRSRNE